MGDVPIPKTVGIRRVETFELTGRKENQGAFLRARMKGQIEILLYIIQDKEVAPSSLSTFPSPTLNILSSDSALPSKLLPLWHCSRYLFFHSFLHVFVHSFLHVFIYLFLHVFIYFCEGIILSLYAQYPEYLAHNTV